MKHSNRDSFQFEEILREREREINVIKTYAEVMWDGIKITHDMKLNR